MTLDMPNASTFSGVSRTSTFAIPDSRNAAQTVTSPWTRPARHAPPRRSARRPPRGSSPRAAVGGKPQHVTAVGGEQGEPVDQPESPEGPQHRPEHDRTKPVPPVEPPLPRPPRRGQTAVVRPRRRVDNPAAWPVAAAVSTGSTSRLSASRLSALRLSASRRVMTDDGGRLLRLRRRAAQWHPPQPRRRSWRPPSVPRVPTPVGQR